MMVTEDMQVYRSRPLPLCDRTARADVDVARDAVPVMTGDLVAVQINDIQIAFANLPPDVVVPLVRRHHQVQVLLEAVVVVGADPRLHGRSTVIADGGRDDHLVGETCGTVDDRSEPFAGPPGCRERRKLAQFSRVIVNDVGNKVAEGGDHDRVDLGEVPLVMDQDFHAVREFRKSSIGDAQVEVIHPPDGLTGHPLFDVPIREQHDRCRRSTPASAFLSPAVFGLDVGQRCEGIRPLAFALDGGEGSFVVTPQRSQLCLELRRLDVGLYDLLDLVG